MSDESDVLPDRPAERGQATGTVPRSDRMRSTIQELRETWGAQGGPIHQGNSSPEGAVKAGIGELYLQSDAAHGDAIWAKIDGTGTTGWVPLQTRLPWVSAMAYGVKADGHTDDSTALQSAVDNAYIAHNAAVLLPFGQIRLTKTLRLRQGVMLLGGGSQGSTQSYGTVLLHAAKGDCLVWDGSGRSGVGYAGTGGGLQNIVIAKGAGYVGGTAITLTGSDADHRAGEMMFTNVLIVGTSAGVGHQNGLWDQGLLIDGRQINTHQSKGVRSIVLHKFRVAGCQGFNSHIVLRQVTHFTGTHVEVDTAGAPGTTGITVDTGSTNVSFLGLIAEGNLVINDGATDVTIVGLVRGELSVGSVNRLAVIANAKTLTVNSEAVGSFVGTTESLTNLSRHFSVFGASAVVSAGPVQSSGRVGATRLVAIDYNVSQEDETLVVDATARDLALTLPTPTAAAGRCYVFKRIDASSHRVVVRTATRTAIDDGPERALAHQWDVLRIQSDGRRWLVL